MDVPDVRSSVYVLGAGGHASVIVSTMQAAGMGPSLVLDDNAQMPRKCILGCVVQGTFSIATESNQARAIIAVGDNSTRRRIAELFPDLEYVAVIHPQATVHPSVQIGGGAVVFAGAVIQPNSVIGKHAIINTGATVDHDCTIGDYAHLAPGCHLAGNVDVEEGAFLGVGVSAIPGVTVGAWAIVGAGAAIITDLPAHVKAVGVPAKPISDARQ